MRRNTHRRAALLDAAIDVLAGEGVRGLTFRTVDANAKVPAGTTSNYFSTRDDLFAQISVRVYARLSPGTEEISDWMNQQPSREVIRRAMHDLFARVRRDRVGYLALLELRLEATRRPQVRDVLAEAVSLNVEESVRFQAEQGVAGDKATFVALYLSMTGLIFEYATLPDYWEEENAGPLIDELVNRIVPEQDPGPQREAHGV